jgi:hypothetical protein
MTSVEHYTRDNSLAGVVPHRQRKASQPIPPSAWFCASWLVSARPVHALLRKNNSAMAASIAARMTMPDWFMVGIGS